MPKKLWNERGEAIIDRNGNLHPVDSSETDRIYGENADNVRDNGSIYDKDGGFYLED
jgi:hypothetical protein